MNTIKIGLINGESLKWSSAAGPNDFFSADDISLLAEIGETILPESDRSPGAKAARIGEFMKTMVTDCYGEEDQSVFLSGLDEVRRISRETYDLLSARGTSGSRNTIPSEVYTLD